MVMRMFVSSVWEMLRAEHLIELPAVRKQSARKSARSRRLPEQDHRRARPIAATRSQYGLYAAGTAWERNA
jgi:hypothetical protein